jgi:serine/threonine-protein kinase
MTALPRLPEEFKLFGLLGRGSMCDVFYGRHQVLDVPIVVKILGAQSLNDPELSSRLRFEARLHAQLDKLRSQHFPRCYHSGLVEDLPYLVMERLHGSTLQELLRKGSFDALTVIDVGIQLFEALRVVHSCGASGRRAAECDLRSARPQQDRSQVN